MFLFIKKKICFLILVVFSFSSGQEYRIGQLNFLKEETSIKTDIKAGESIQAVQSFEEKISLEEAINPHEYILGPGDELGVNILMGENLTLPIKVTPTGDVFIPSVGVINVSDISLNDGIEKIEKFILDNTFPNAKVSIALVNLRKFQIQVIGAVNKPGFVRASVVDRLDRIIARTKGFHQLAKEFEITVKRNNGIIEQINHLKFIRNGDLEENPTFLEGDVIYVPFGDLVNESVAVRGAVKGVGYDIIEMEESLLEFLSRRIRFVTSSDLESVIVTRQDNGKSIFLPILPINFSNFTLRGGDIIDILTERGVMVNGFVQVPGAYEHKPGYAVYDYISIAGGNTLEGDIERAVVHHPDGTIETGNVIIHRGDVIVVPRSHINFFVGRLSLLQMTAYIFSIYMSYLAATNL